MDNQSHELDDVLLHFGIKGMRWGVRRKSRGERSVANETSGRKLSRGERSVANEKKSTSSGKLSRGERSVANEKTERKLSRGEQAMLKESQKTLGYRQKLKDASAKRKDSNFERAKKEANDTADAIAKLKDRVKPRKEVENPGYFERRKQESVKRTLSNLDTKEAAARQKATNIDSYQKALKTRRIEKGKVAVDAVAAKIDRAKAPKNPSKSAPSNIKSIRPLIPTKKAKAEAKADTQVLKMLEKAVREGRISDKRAATIAKEYREEKRNK